MDVGRIGIWRVFDADDDVPVEEIESLGFSTLWVGNSQTPATG